MRVVKQQKLLSSHQLIIILVSILSVACLGMLALINGYIPFSPSFFASYPLSAFGLYTVIVISIYSFEMRPSPLSVRPYSPEDPQRFFQAYVISAILWGGGLLPVCWLKVGKLSVQGISLDQIIYVHVNWIMGGFIGAFVVYLLRQKAIEEKDIGRVNRISPALSQVNIAFDVAPGWNHSDVWDVIPMTGDELKAIAKRDKESYEQRRQDKLTRDSQIVQQQRSSGFFDLLSDTQSVLEVKYSTSEDNPTNDALPTWLSQATNSQTLDMSLDTAVRRSVNDFDTRFDQNVIPHHEILGENIRWSGVNRPSVKPKPTPQHVRLIPDYPQTSRSITQGFTPLPLVKTPLTNLEDHSDLVEYKQSISTENYETSEAPTTPPNGLIAISTEEPSLQQLGGLSFLRNTSTEDQELFEEVIDVISKTQIKVTQVGTSHALNRMSFSQLDELVTQKVDSGSHPMFKSTSTDKGPWFGDE